MIRVHVLITTEGSGGSEIKTVLWEDDDFECIPIVWWVNLVCRLNGGTRFFVFLKRKINFSLTMEFVSFGDRRKLSHAAEVDLRITELGAIHHRRFGTIRLYIY